MAKVNEQKQHEKPLIPNPSKPILPQPSRPVLPDKKPVKPNQHPLND